MASADKTYVDPSALRRLYVHDPASRSFCAWRGRQKGGLPLTLHGRAELVNSIALAVFRRDLTVEMAAAALSDLASDIAEGRLALADLPWRLALERAAALSWELTPTLGTRTLDVLHVASALTLGSRAFVTYDDRQLALAAAVGLRTLRP